MTSSTKRLDEGQTLDIQGNEVVVATVTTRELIGLFEAESNSIKVEAMAQRSYTVHCVVARAASPRGGSIEDFIAALEQEEPDRRHGDPVNTAKRPGTDASPSFNMRDSFTAATSQPHHATLSRSPLRRYSPPTCAPQRG